MFGLIIFSTLVHMSLSAALSPLLFNLPRTLAAEEELRKAGNDPFLAEILEDKNDGLDTQDAEMNDVHGGYDSDFDPSDPTDTVAHTEQTSRGGIPIEGGDAAIDLTTTTVTGFLRKKYNASPLPSVIRAVDFWTYWITPNPNQKPNFVLKFLHPEIFADYHILRAQIPESIREYRVEYEEGVLKDAFSPKSVRNKSPRIWIPRDRAGVSVQEVRHSSKVVEVGDADAWLSDKGLVSVDLEGEMGRWVLRDWEKVKF
jgi:hypothetical protein